MFNACQRFWDVLGRAKKDISKWTDELKKIVCYTRKILSQCNLEITIF